MGFNSGFKGLMKVSTRKDRCEPNMSLELSLYSITLNLIKPLKMKRRLLYLKTQFVTGSKQFSSRLSKPINLLSKFYYQLMHKRIALKRNIKIYIKTAPTFSM